MLHSELIIFIRYKDNSYYFICHTQENNIFYFTHTIFNEKLFSKYTNFHVKECKLYNELLDKISLEIELLVPGPSGKDEPILIPILHISIPFIQNNSPTCSPLLSSFYKFLSPLPTPKSKKLIIEIEKDDDVDSNVEI